MGKLLHEVESFGGIDADADKLLDLCFQDHEAYIAAKDHQRFLVIGRKGSGKTAIYRKLITTSEPTIFSIGHTFSDYPWHHHDAQAQLGVPEEERYTHSWKYLILLTASKILLNDDQSQPWNEHVVEDIGRLESFVVDSYGTRKPDVTQFFAPGRVLRVNPTLKIGNGAVGMSLERVPIAQLPTIVQEVNRTVAASVMAALHPEHDYHVVFDQLDLGFNPNDPKYAQRLTGLILAARDLSHQAAACAKRLSVSIFLRDDIYQLLRFEDKNKISENSMSRIEWDSVRTRWTLKHLMESRFAEVMDIPEKGAWERVFDEEQEMRSRQSKYQHILDRTFRRPRDIIKFCNEVLDAYKARVNATSDDRFRNEDLIRARDRYSEYLLSELEDEVFKHVPEYAHYIEILKHIGTVQFNKDDFARTRQETSQLFSSQSTTEEILSRLFEFSIIGYLKTGGGGGGSAYVWHYLDSRSHFDSSATSFRVHPGFKEVLGLKQGGRGPAEDE